MSGLEDIPIALGNALPAQEAPSPTVLAVLQETANMVQTFLETQQSDSIDLRSLPLTPGDYDLLGEMLGEGEVSATIDAAGPTLVRETAYPGIWWITHLNNDDEVVAEFIEVTRCPEILKSQWDDISDSLEQLRSLLSRPMGP
jgi:hydrogenase-1 operon protein HyaF